MFKNLILVAGLSISSLFATAQSKNITYKSSIPYQGLSNIWGFKDTTGKEYALAGANNHLSIVDVTNPAQPIKRFSVPGPNSAWREIRTYGRYAYVTTEGGGGVTIVDLRSLPDTIHYKNYTGDGAVTGFIDAIHALHIDNNKLYLYGGNYQGGRAKVFSLADPWNPVYLGTVSQRYVHDGYVRNDTLYSCQIYAGKLEIIDATNPQNPVIINSQITPSEFTHNSWMSTNRKVIYTTDEVEASYVTAYDISDLQNIKELDRYRHNNSGSIAHNTYVLNDSSITGYNADFLWTSYYTDGITLVDATRPHNLIEVGYYDSSPTTGSGFSGAWGVYSYLPSGTILVSDMENGMHVVTPQYKRASYLEGTVRDAFTNDLLVNAKIEFLVDTNANTRTNLNGSFATGKADSGTYQIVVSLFGYFNDTLSVVLREGQVNNLNVQLIPVSNFAMTKTITDSNANAIANADVLINNKSLGNKYMLKSNANGQISVPVFYSGVYDFVIGKFGYETKLISNVSIQSATDLPDLSLAAKYYDDFVFENNWKTTGDPDNGGWVRAVPIKTTSNNILANPDFDVINDIGDMAYVTENASGPATFGDVDNGEVILESPIMNFSNYTNPYINYSRWFSNLASSGTPNDTMTISISNGTETKVIEKIWGNRSDRGTWVDKSFRVLDYLSLTNNMKLTVKVAETPTEHVTEGGFDKFFVSDSAAVVGLNNEKSIVSFNIYPNPNNGKATIDYAFHKLSNDASISCYNVLGNKVFENKLTEAQGQVNVELAQGGLYLIKLSNGAEQRVIKMLVK